MSTPQKTNPFKEAAQQLDLPVAAIYGALVVAVSLIGGVVISSQASLQKQELATLANYQIVGCNQACASNRNCQPNHFCYQGRCRLASNPTDELCGGSASIQDPAQDPSQKGYDPGSADINDTQTSVDTSQDLQTQDQLDLLEPSSPMSKLNETFSFAQNSSQVMLIIGLGLIGLVVVIAISSMLSASSSKNKVIKPIRKEVPKPDFSSLEGGQKEIKLEKSKEVK